MRISHYWPSYDSCFDSIDLFCVVSFHRHDRNRGRTAVGQLSSIVNVGQSKGLDKSGVELFSQRCSRLVEQIAESRGSSTAGQPVSIVDRVHAPRAINGQYEGRSVVNCCQLCRPRELVQKIRQTSLLVKVGNAHVSLAIRKPVRRPSQRGARYRGKNKEPWRLLPCLNFLSFRTVVNIHVGDLEPKTGSWP